MEISRTTFASKHLTVAFDADAPAGAEAQNGSIALKVSDAEDQTEITVTLPRFCAAAA